MKYLVENYNFVLFFQQQQVSMISQEQIQQTKRVAEDTLDNVSKKRRAVFGDITNVSMVASLDINHSWIF